MRTVAQVTGVGVLDDQIHQRLAALLHCGAFTQVIRHGPGGGFVDPHERGFDQKPFVHA